MPTCSSVRFNGRFDCSTNRMISSFSDAVYLIYHLLHPRSCFLGKTVLQHLFCWRLFELATFRPEGLDLMCIGFALCVSRQAILAGFHEVLRPSTIEVLVDTFPETQFGGAALTAQSLNYNAYLLFRRTGLAGRPADIFDRLLGATGFAGFCRLLPCHLRSLCHHDNP